MSGEKGTSTGLEPAGADVGSGEVVTKRGILHRLLHGRDHLDELGKEMLKQSLQYDQAQLEADAVKVKRKLDLLVLPMVREDPGNDWQSTA